MISVEERDELAYFCNNTLYIFFKVSAESGREKKVYEYLHKLRAAVRGVNGSTAEIIESWFNGEKAAMVGLVNWDEDEVKEAILTNGGGWHGLGWLGTGKWIIQRSSVASDGRCCACDQQLTCVDIDRAETEKFAQSVASLAMEREVQSNFKEFQVGRIFFNVFCIICKTIIFQSFESSQDDFQRQYEF